MKHLCGFLFFLFSYNFICPLFAWRLMSYNICHGSGMDDSISYDRTANVLITYRPDVVAVQEVDSCTQRCNGAYVLEELTKRTGMYASFAPAIDYGGGKYGIGVLSREKPLKMQYYPLPGREECRALLIVEFTDYVFCCTHQSLTLEDRMLSVSLIFKYLSVYKGRKRVFLAGDLNALPNSAFIQQLQQEFIILNDVNEFTCPADKPQSTIDYIMQMKDKKFPVLPCSSRVVPESVASDHRPVLVNLK